MHFHPSAITIAVSAGAFQSVQSTHRQSTVAISACVSNIRVSTHSSLCVSELVLSSSTPVNENHFCSPHNRQPESQSVLVDSMVCISLCASILFVLPLAITPPPAGHHRVALSISAPVNKNHCAFHPSAITIAISACAFQSVQSTHRQSTVAISACVSNIRVSTHSSLCVPPATIRTCAF